MRKAIAAVLAMLACAGSETALSGIPMFNFSCPLGLELHADEGGPIYANGQEARLKKFNENYYEATDPKSKVVASVSINPDGSPTISVTGKNGANGICSPAKSGAQAASAAGVQPATAAVAPGNMPAYCRGEAAGRFNVKPNYIKTAKLSRDRQGGYVVAGSADLGAQGKKPFQCEFDREMKFKYFKSLVDEGSL